MSKRIGAVMFIAALLAGSLAGCGSQKPDALADGTPGKLVPFTAEGLSGFSYGPVLAGVDVLEGSPQFKVVTVDKQNGVKSGFWESTKGKWRFANGKDHWEYCRIVEGVSVITEDGGRPRRFEAGQSFVLHPGFSGTWEVIEPTRKEYVIVTIKP